MIDFLKLNVSYLSESELLNNPLIEWKQLAYLNTAELTYPIIGEYRNLIIKINPTRKELTGSIHKLSNILNSSHNQNFNDFPYDNVKETIFHLKKDFNLNLNKTIIENLEIGINIQTLKTPERFLNENLIVWNNKTPAKNKHYNGKGKYMHFETAQFYFKIYDKGRQFERHENILRVECKIIRNSFLKKSGITTLKDLLNRDHLKTLLEFLYQTFALCVIVDDLSTEIISERKEREIFTKGINPLFWSNFPNRTTRQRFKKYFTQILEIHNLNTIHKEIELKLKLKGNELLKCYEMNDLQNVENQCQIINLLRNEPYINFQNVTTKKCLVTGIEICHQKIESKFLSMSSIKKLSEIEPETFKTLLTNFSPKKPESMTFDKLCLEIAHNIRNRHSNKKIQTRRKTIFYEKSFFPLIEIFSN